MASPKCSVCGELQASCFCPSDDWSVLVEEIEEVGQLVHESKSNRDLFCQKPGGDLALLRALMQAWLAQADEYVASDTWVPEDPVGEEPVRWDDDCP